MKKKIKINDRVKLNLEYILNDDKSHGRFYLDWIKKSRDKIFIVENTNGKLYTSIVLPQEESANIKLKGVDLWLMSEKELILIK